MNNLPTQNFKPSTAPITAPPARNPRLAIRGLTLLEALIASVILSGMVLATAAAISASQQHGQFAQDQVQAALAVEAKLAEILADEYLNLPNYHGADEPPGTMITAQGASYPPEYYRIGRNVTIIPLTITIPELGGLTINGYEITITAYDLENNDVFFITQFIPEPTT